MFPSFLCSIKQHFTILFSGNEVCPEVATISESCHFNVSGYFSYNNYTVVIIISNDVSKVVTPVSVILYKGKYILFIND